MSTTCVRRSVTEADTYLIDYECDAGSVLLKLRPKVVITNNVHWEIENTITGEIRDALPGTGATGGNASVFANIRFVDFPLAPCCDRANITIYDQVAGVYAVPSCCGGSGSGSGSGVGNNTCDDGTCRYAIYIGNENAVTDDDFSVHLNGAQIATTSGIGNSCSGTLILPQSVSPMTTTIVGETFGLDTACDGVTMALTTLYSAALDNPPASNTVEVFPIVNNGAGNYGRIRIYRVCVTAGSIQLIEVAEDVYLGVFGSDPVATVSFAANC